MPTVRLFTCFLQLLTGLALPAPQWALSPGNISSAVEVVPFEQVWSRSYCRPVERLVDIVSEYPSEVEHMFSPSCVSLMRCTGCCSDETMHCMPLETANVTMQLMKYHSLDQPFFVEMSFSQHVRCECKPLRGRMKPKRRRSRVRGPRKREEQKHKDCHLCGDTVSRRIEHRGEEAGKQMVSAPNLRSRPDIYEEEGGKQQPAVVRPPRGRRVGGRRAESGRADRAPGSGRFLTQGSHEPGGL
ncbi:hypothetical protein R6Z07F_008768 [Ovis aries]